jgi:TRAP-type C4-dicarboxylate transport system permease small subunit
MASDSRSIFVKFLEYSLVILISIVVLLVLVQVFSRYLIQLPFIGLEELARLVFVWACFLGTSLGVIRSRHISIEVLLRVLPARMSQLFSVITAIMILIVSAVMVIYGLQFVVNKWSYPDYSTALLYPRSLFYLPVPLSGAIIFFYTIKQTLGRLMNGVRTE